MKILYRIIYSQWNAVTDGVSAQEEVINPLLLFVIIWVSSVLRSSNRLINQEKNQCHTESFQENSILRPCTTPATAIHYSASNLASSPYLVGNETLQLLEVTSKWCEPDVHRFKSRPNAQAWAEQAEVCRVMTSDTLCRILSEISHQRRRGTVCHMRPVKPVYHQV